MNDRDNIAGELDAVSFSLIDIMMYLDTHPNDAAALRAKAEYAEAADKLRRRYEQSCGPLTASAADGDCCWDWIADPWPWEV